jgi:hypothetical protein
MWRSPETHNPPKLDSFLLSIRMVEGHYFEIVTTVHYSNWNQTSFGFHYATYLVWLQE